VQLPLPSTYDPLLVTFSFAMAMAAAYTSLDVAGRTPSRRDDHERLWMVAGSLTMGLGIWSMHFIGMVAFHIGLAIQFDVATTLVSLGCSVAGAAVALRTVSAATLTWGRWAGGTLLMGSTLGAMHYLGMSAMRMQAVVTYDPFWFAASGLIAVGASGLALWLAFEARSESLATWSGRKVGSAAVLGTAIAGMHYAGMAAAKFLPTVCAPPTLPTLDISHLGIAAIACATLFVMMASLLSAYKANLQAKQADLDAITVLNAELKASEERYRQLADAMPQIVWTATADGRIEYVNRGWSDYTGQPIDADLREAWLAAVHPDEVDATMEQWFAAVRGGTIFETAYRLRRGSDGSYRWHLGRAIPARDAAGQVERWYGTYTDIHEQRELAEELRRHRQRVELEVALRTRELAEREEALQTANHELRQADRHKDEFLSVISHELRTPLNFITGFASVLADGLAGPVTQLQADHLGKILNGADRMLLLVNDLLDFAKLQYGKFELSPAPTRFPALVDEALALMAPIAAQKGLQLEAVHGADVEIQVDGPRITQVLTNLLSNAIKFTDAGSVRVRSAIEGHELITYVEDQGCGIAAEHLPRLFQRFQQLDMSDTRRAGGTGLGLVICKALVEAHGGTIGLASIPGEGTTVRFSLPLAARPAAVSV
jgi:PAS domain S-box-containing protein